MRKMVIVAAVLLTGIFMVTGAFAQKAATLRIGINP